MKYLHEKTQKANKSFNGMTCRIPKLHYIGHQKLELSVYDPISIFN